jgi:hypothetical protein
MLPPNVESQFESNISLRLFKAKAKEDIEGVFRYPFEVGSNYSANSTRIVEELERPFLIGRLQGNLQQGVVGEIINIVSDKLFERPKGTAHICEPATLPANADVDPHVATTDAHTIPPISVAFQRFIVALEGMPTPPGALDSDTGFLKIQTV